MRKFFIKIGLIILAASGLFIWFRTDASVIAGASVLGMDDSTGWAAANSHNPEVLDTLEAANTGMLRVELPWDAVEVSPAVFSWTIETELGRIDFDALFSRLQRHGIEPVVVLTSGPAYLSHLYPQQPVHRDQLLENWERYVRAAIGQFGDRVNYWQVGGTINDPAEWGRVLFPAADAPEAVPDPVLYSDMLKVAYSVIKSKQAGDTVLLGELAFTSDCIYHPNNYLQALADQDAWYAFDAASISLPILTDAPENAVVDTCGTMPVQPSGIPGADSILAVADIIDKIGHKPLWVHNLRFAATFLNEEAAQRGTLYEIIASDFLARASGLFLAYGDVDRIFWVFAPLENIPGLIALQTYANLSHTLSGRFDGNGLPKSKDAFALRFRSNGKLSLLAWYTNGGEQAVPMTISGVEGYRLKAFSADSDSLKPKHGIAMPVDDGGNIALLVSERPVLISGRPGDIKGTVTQTVEDSAAQASAGMQAKLNNWIQAQKAKAAARVGDWVEKQQASLLDSLRTSLEEWLRKSLGLA